ncbi:hypothetical protein [Halapricum desulfuricans]|uniref:Uncharacterized protein n=1 Tax=Halapricum desulfuricans TaxID=2841257 RepID=A0A897NU13_9EURY|nr:hypothetical protein [Halapricum desulfuricans]QSG14283.1 hypothetical protein HSEST_0738 [Halapricum desulfuricans]
MLVETSLQTNAEASIIRHRFLEDIREDDDQWEQYAGGITPSIEQNPSEPASDFVDDSWGQIKRRQQFTALVGTAVPGDELL